MCVSQAGLLVVASVESRRLAFDWLMVQTGESLNSIQPLPLEEGWIISFHQTPARYLFLQVRGRRQREAERSVLIGAGGFTPV